MTEPPDDDWPPPIEEYELDRDAGRAIDPDAAAFWNRLGNRQPAFGKTPAPCELIELSREQLSRHVVALLQRPNQSRAEAVLAAACLQLLDGQR